MASITWENITKTFGQTVAVDHLNLECEDGEFLALLGPSGCGKTTLLRMTAGLENPSEGQIYFDDQVVNQLEPRERNMAMVFEGNALYPHKSVYDNIAYPLELRNFSSNEIDSKVKEMAELLEIEGLLERYPRDISGGQQQRVGIARALVRDPSAFALDEPLSHLDAKLRATMRAELKRLFNELGVTAIYVTHDQLEALTMADKVAVMNQGELQQHAEPMELFSDPVNYFVAKFVGEPSMNFLQCEIQKEEDSTFLATEGVFLKLSTALSSALDDHKTDGSVILGARPQHLMLHHVDEKSSDHDNILSGTVYLEEPMGAQKLVLVQVGENQIEVLTDQDFEVTMDEPILVEIPRDRFYLFDQDTGERIK